MPSIASRDMLVPVAVFAMVEGNQFENRSTRYLVEGLAHLYPEITAAREWPEWVQLVESIEPLARQAFEGKHNLHEDSATILKMRLAYEAMRAGRP